MSNDITSVIAYRTLFGGSGVHHSNAGLQITYDMYIAGYLILLFDLTPDRAASEGHTSYPDNGSIRKEVKFAKALPDAITCLLYMGFDNTVRIHYSKRWTRLRYCPLYVMENRVLVVFRLISSPTPHHALWLHNNQHSSAYGVEITLVAIHPQPKSFR
jgi:hypothetical protein